jgi:phosphate starvation-inducible PhoH-like protein
MGKTPKTRPTFGVSLAPEQAVAAEKFYTRDVNFILGDFASGKTFLSSFLADQGLCSKDFNKIVITRPVVEERMGHEPGTIEEKMAKWVYPILGTMQELEGKEAIEKKLTKGDISILELGQAKGMTYTQSIIIVDEFQDMNYEDFRTILTRLGKGSKIIFCGSKEQRHRKMRSFTCIPDVMKLKNYPDLVSFTELTGNHRNPILTPIINVLENDEKHKDSAKECKAERVDETLAGVDQAISQADTATD